TNAAQQVYVFRTIVTPAAAALHRPDLRKAALPKPQHMLRQIEIVRDLTDRTKGVGRLVQSRLSVGSELNYPSWPSWPSDPPLMRCLRIAEGLNTITRRGDIGTSVPVFGLRPIRWPFLRTTKEPNEESFTVSPRSRQSVISLRTSSTSAADSVRDNPTCWYTASQRSARVTVFSVIASLDAPNQYLT